MAKRATREHRSRGAGDDLHLCSFPLHSIEVVPRREGGREREREHSRERGGQEFPSAAADPDRAKCPPPGGGNPTGTKGQRLGRQPPGPQSDAQRRPGSPKAPSLNGAAAPLGRSLGLDVPAQALARSRSSLCTGGLW